MSLYGERGEDGGVKGAWAHSSHGRTEATNTCIATN